MKIETIITAVIFFGVGFLAGYIYKTEREPATVIVGAASGATQSPGDESSSAAPGAQNSMPGLPQGHPPLDEAAVINGLEQQAAQNPTDSQIPLKLANYCYDKRLFQLADEWYQKALALDPKNADARTDYGTALYYSGRTQDAIKQYRQALAISPDHEQTLYNMIVVNLEGTHDLRAAQQYWEKLHQRDPNYQGLAQIKEELDAARGGSAGH